MGIKSILIYYCLYFFIKINIFVITSLLKSVVDTIILFYNKGNNYNNFQFKKKEIHVNINKKIFYLNMK